MIAYPLGLFVHQFRLARVHMPIVNMSMRTPHYMHSWHALTCLTHRLPRPPTTFRFGPFWVRSKQCISFALPPTHSQSRQSVLLPDETIEGRLMLGGLSNVQGELAHTKVTDQSGAGHLGEGRHLRPWEEAVASPTRTWGQNRGRGRCRRALRRGPARGGAQFRTGAQLKCDGPRLSWPMRQSPMRHHGYLSQGEKGRCN
jgi:hypothetical protein